MSKEFDINSRADEVITDYAETSFKRAFQAAEKVVHGGGCTCRLCSTSAAHEANEWMDFLDPDQEFPRYAYDGRQVTRKKVR